MSIVTKYYTRKMAEDYERLEWDFLEIKPLDRKLLRKLSREIDYRLYENNSNVKRIFCY